MSISFTNDQYESEGFKPFASGWVDAQISDFGDDTNKAGTGELAWFEFTVTSGVDKGRTFRQFYNYEHPNEDAQRISREHICAIARIVNVKNIVLPEGLGDFNNKKLRIRISQKKNDEFPQIKEYAPLNQDGFDSLVSDEFEVEPTPQRARRADPYAQ